MGELFSHKRRVSAIIVMMCLIMVAVFSSKSMAVPLVSPPDTPSLTTPTGDSRTNKPDVLFSWSETGQATHYELRYARLDSCSVDPEDTTIHAGEFVGADPVTVVSLEPKMLVSNMREGLWCWQVRAVASTGAVSAWSEVRKMTLDMTQPVLTVRQPLADRISGTVDEQSKIELILDGAVRSDVPVSVSAALNSNETYDWSLALPELASGNHTYALRVVDTAGNEMTTVTASFAAETTDKPGVITSTHHEMLPLVPMGPLVFIASPAREPMDIETMAPIIDSSTTNAMAIEVPTRIERLARSDVSVSHNPVQATERGWLLLGVAWYWWVIGIGLFAALTWMVLLRIQLATRLNWIGAV